VFISILHPAALLRVLTLAVWGALLLSLEKLPKYAHITIDNVKIFKLLFNSSDPQIRLDHFAPTVLKFSATPALTVAVFFLVVALLLGVWGLFPAVWAEVVPPRRRQEGKQAEWKRYAQSLGVWLTHGYTCLFRVAPWLVYVAVPVLFFLGYCARFADLGGLLDSPGLKRLNNWLDEDNKFLMYYLSFAMSAILLALFCSRGSLQPLALGFHSAVRAALDVDNHMREFPYDATPRAKIFARYASLLRYLCKWRNPEDGRGYGAIVFAAHSQGTVITGDLLRFLQRQDPLDDGLAVLCPSNPTKRPLAPKDGVIPIYFLTVGCPLRQLYGSRFPHLYEWAYHEDTPVKVDGTIPEGQKPDPKELGLSCWVNAYRSGDYVGRYLWRTDNSDCLWQPDVESVRADALAVEVCIGPGAHTGYFSEIEIGTYLDELIRVACNQAAAAWPRYPQ
jgi:hypothetical protein